MIGLHLVRPQKFISTGFKYVYRSLPLNKMHLSVSVCVMFTGNTLRCSKASDILAST